MTKKIYFDLDGTVYNLYGQKDWLKRLDNEDETVFKTGDFIGDYDEFMATIHKLFEKGVEFGVITWLPMYATPSFERKCAEIKKDWIYKYLPFVNEIHIIPYGIPKQQAILKKTDLMVLIDDNKEVCFQWNNSRNRISLNVGENSATDLLKQFYETL